MILTITMNPSIDIVYPIDHLLTNTVNRVNEVSKTAGGKGLNVTRVLHQVGAPVTASGLLGGHLGEAIRQKLDKCNISHDFSTIQGETRNCIAIIHDRQQTEILESGPTISSEEASGFLEKFEILVQEANVLTISGSLPNGLPSDFYVKMINISNQYNTPVILDVSGKALKDVLEHSEKPFLIKPNIEELAALFNLEKSPQNDEIKQLLLHPLFKDIEWIVVSLGSEGAIAKHHNQFYRVSIPKINAINPVGSGDSTVAGIAWAIDNQQSDDVLLRRGNTLGMLNAMEEQTGYVNMSHFTELYNQIDVQII
ncbi:tagatose-6-phosphate kinase [Atopobacter phocae]|uniref:tagatose-6-phosphate kinase n=1 Tax=Atopobacter phocae TaxID=136492 RepID=UPI0004711DF5|nr:tagatose-6-phosphate kinase [Atopobacter phocae]